MLLAIVICVVVLIAAWRFQSRVACRHHRHCWDEMTHTCRVCDTSKYELWGYTYTGQPMVIESQYVRQQTESLERIIRSFGIPSTVGGHMNAVKFLPEDKHP